MSNGESVTCPWSGETSAPIPEATYQEGETGFPVVPVLAVLVLVAVAVVLTRG